MSKHIMTVALIAFASWSGQAMAVCPPGALNKDDLRSLLDNQYAVANRGAESWHELHRFTADYSGTVCDYKLGPSSTVDPSKVVGEFAIGGSGSLGPAPITYTYGSEAFTYYVYGSGNPYTFCNISTDENLSVNIQPGDACP